MPQTGFRPPEIAHPRPRTTPVNCAARDAKNVAGGGFGSAPGTFPGPRRPRGAEPAHRPIARARRARPGAPDVATLAGLGVARISLGSAVAQAAYAVVRQAAREELTTGTYTALAGALDYGELNGLSA
jgi:hypothetical protein